ncbi:MAG: NPCBM/NEW2 domain-containing protein, partial [Planctomycetaceae bacterium]
MTAEEVTELRRLAPAGNALWSSDIVRKSRPSADVDLELAGAQELHLVVTNAGDGDSCDHADWAEARLVTAAGETPLSELKWRAVTATYG